MAFGVLAGTLIRRTLPAMAVTLVGFIAVRLPIEFLPRPHFMTPVTAIGVTNAAPAGAWLLDQGLVESHGRQQFLQHWGALERASPVSHPLGNQVRSKDADLGQQCSELIATDPRRHVPTAHDESECVSPTMRSSASQAAWPWASLVAFRPSTSSERTANGWRGMVRGDRSNS